MTDRELLELAAKAAGIPLKPDFKERFDYYIADRMMWNPLTDDGDALRLAVKLGLCVGPNFDADRVVVDAGEFSQHHVYQMFDDDKFAATRRAIVRAAAELGKEMK